MSVTSYSVTGQWPLCVSTSDKLISPPKLILLQNSLHLHSLLHGYSFQLTALSSNSFHTQNFPFYNYNNKAWWWNLLVWHKHAYGLFSQLCSAAQPTKFESCLLKYSQTLYCRHCGDLELVSSLVRVRNRRSLFQSNVCNIFLPGI